MNNTELIIKKLLNVGLKTAADLHSFKRKISKKYNIPIIPNAILLKEYHKLLKNKTIKENKEIENLLKKKKVRSLSGIVNVSVLTKPFPCPGKCIYCPFQKNTPKSYLKDEPAVIRAISLKYDPYLQTFYRIKMLESSGHPTDKIELRVVGGTWSFYDRRYQTNFITKCFAACNDYPKIKKNHNNLAKEQKINEKSKHRIVGLSVETRPDYINEEEIKRLRKLGVTMVELGVQSIYNNILKASKREHNIEETIRATKILKNAGFKILYQVMPNLPNSNLKKDEEMFEKLFSEESFKPDLLKIYPCALLKQAPLYQLWKKKKYKPYTKKQLISLLINIKKKIPYYVRIQRIIRDISAKEIIAGGAKISNLREVVKKEMKERGLRCRCIRCREVGDKYNPKEKIFLFREDYFSSGGKEIFLSFENEDRTKLYSLLRLRIPSWFYRKEEKPIFKPLKESAIIRELHTYGPAIPIHKKGRSAQHQGLGKKLIKKAEQVAKEEFKIKKIAIISGVGVRGYYRKLGYRLWQTYMVKKIN